MRWRRRDVAIVSRCAEATFSLTGGYKAECIEGVDAFKYLGWMLYRLDDYWPAVFWNVSKARQVWIRIEELLWRAGVIH